MAPPCWRSGSGDEGREAGGDLGGATVAILHSVPKRKRIKDCRISLTYREIVS
jgi:hypothetical protein